MDDTILKIAKTAALRLGPSKVDPKGTESLRTVTKFPKRTKGDLTSSLLVAAGLAKSMGKSTFVYKGNSYMHSVWHVSQKPGDYLNSINNMGTKVGEVTPDLTLIWHDVEGR